MATYSRHHAVLKAYEEKFFTDYQKKIYTFNPKTRTQSDSLCIHDLQQSNTDGRELGVYDVLAAELDKAVSFCSLRLFFRFTKLFVFY